MDTINPNYYQSAESQQIQIIEIIRDMPFSLGNAVKYIYRCRTKENKQHDLKKALWYVKDHAEHGSQITISENDDYTAISDDLMETLLSRSDAFESESIRKIYDSWLKNGDYSEPLVLIENELSATASKSTE